ncbi:MAG: hypothetical protein OEZ41_04485 [Nitrospirota bacterium]|nr:hypothetical protein [Nitrospirota bacterium]MDH5699202.1 hypothetical protein [Nitrospirota bacterium]
MSNEDLLSRGKDFEQKLQEALVASTFALVFQEHISPVQIRMAKVHEKLRDFELISQDNTSFQFEITTAYPPDYKIREEYKNGRRPSFPMQALSGTPMDPEWIAPVICKKTEKARRIDGFNGHLLVYVNIQGGGPSGPGLEKLKDLISDSESIWRSIWLIRGIPDLISTGTVLLCKSYGLGCEEQEWLHIKEING